MANMFRLSHGMRSAEGDGGGGWKRLLMKCSKRDLWALPAYIISLSGAVARGSRAEMDTGTRWQSLQLWN